MENAPEDVMPLACLLERAASPLPAALLLDHPPPGCRLHNNRQRTCGKIQREKE